MENRIENNLKLLQNSMLVHLPNAGMARGTATFTLDEFVEMQEKWMKKQS